jgi:hypothetical protein
VSAVRSSITTGGAGLAIRGKQIPARGDRCGVLTPSTRFAYPHVVSRTFALFRVVNFSVSAGQRDFCSGFDFRQTPRPPDDRLPATTTGWFSGRQTAFVFRIKSVR